MSLPNLTPYYRGKSVTLYHGDCLEIMPCLMEASVSLVLSDLPYGLTNRCSWDSPLPLTDLWANWGRLLHADGVVALTASQPFTSSLVMSNPGAFKHEWIWEKNAGSNFGSVKRQPMKEHESVLVFSFGRYVYNPIMEERAQSGLTRVKSGVVNYKTSTEVYGAGFDSPGASSMRPDLRYPRSIQRFNRERGLHPTQKPVALMEYLIRTYTQEGWLVLDCCAGSGSTLMAAQRQNRHVIGIEVEEKYCEVIANRLEGELS